MGLWPFDRGCVTHLLHSFALHHHHLIFSEHGQTLMVQIYVFLDLVLARLVESLFGLLLGMPLCLFTVVHVET